MPLLHSFIAIAAGFACMALLTAPHHPAHTLARAKLDQKCRPRAWRRSSIWWQAASMRHWEDGLTATIAPISPLVHSLILAIVVLLISTLAASELRGQALGFYPLALAVLPSLTTLGSGVPNGALPLNLELEADAEGHGNHADGAGNPVFVAVGPGESTHRYRASAYIFAPPVADIVGDTGTDIQTAFDCLKK